MAFTEFYCQNGGSNVNAGSTTNNTAAYTSIHGNWDTTTRVFTPTDGTTPASSVTVGNFASVYIDAAAVAVYIGRITVVVAGVNGAITVPAANAMGSSPANQTGTATIKVGGAWLGPNAASTFPYGLAAMNLGTNASGDRVRVNLKNDQTYTMTSAMAFANADSITTQGFTSTAGDGGAATFSSNVVGSTLYTLGSGNGSIYQDIIFTNTGASSSQTLMGVAQSGSLFNRCVFKNSRGHGTDVTNRVIFNECEWFGNNSSNTAAKAALLASSTAAVAVCNSGYIHDNTGSNTDGISLTAGSLCAVNTIIESNGNRGINFAPTSSGQLLSVSNCDIYNNGSDAIKGTPGDASSNVLLKNVNVIKNTGKALNWTLNSSSGVAWNLGYGSGTQANGSSDSLKSLDQGGSITYASNTTPYSAPTTGNFSIVSGVGIGAGRGTFTETDGTNTGTVGYPDIGAAQAVNGTGISREVSYGIGS